ncbi:MAG: hypothetical protein AAFQ99_12380, partial [Pseudomonadota bacterium]
GTEGYALRGWEGVIATDLPPTLDVGGDAALLLALMRAFSETSGFTFEAQAMANIADKAYTDFIGARSILPSLYAIALSEPKGGVLLDTQSFAIEPVPYPPEARVLVLDTVSEPQTEEIEREVIARVDGFAEAAHNYKVTHLRDLSMARFEKDAESLDEHIARRARHFLTENGRTILAAEMIRSGALSTVGKMMHDSHVSLREEYEIGNEAADEMIEAVMAQSNVFGARWSGFGAAAVALVRDFSADTISKLTVQAYKKATGREATAVIVGPAAGIERL